jgi:NADH dehydrogenase
MILVLGATGRLGGIITQRLLAEGKPVRILVRPTSAYQALVEAGAQPTIGDLKDRASLDAACAGIETVITTANSAVRGGADNVQSVELEGNRNLIDAARAAGVQQFLFTTSLGSTVESPMPFIQAKARSEQYLRASGMPYTILGLNVLMDIWVGRVVNEPLRAGQPVTLIGEGRRKHTFIAMADVAAFATAALGHPAALNRYMSLGGPEALSWRDIIAAFEGVLGRALEVRSVPPGETPPGLPEIVAHFMAGLETYETPLDMTETARTFGVRMTTVEEHIRQNYGGVGR